MTNTTTIPDVLKTLELALVTARSILALAEADKTMSDDDYSVQAPLQRGTAAGIEYAIDAVQQMQFHIKLKG